MNSILYDEFLRVAWEMLKREETKWLEQGHDEEDQEYYEGTNPTFGRWGLTRHLREQKELSLREANDIVTDYFKRHPDYDYEEREAQKREELQRKTEPQIDTQPIQKQNIVRKWWQFWQ